MDVGFASAAGQQGIQRLDMITYDVILSLHVLYHTDSCLACCNMNIELFTTPLSLVNNNDLVLYKPLFGQLAAHRGRERTQKAK